jgi:hypothetical protein
MRKNTGPNPINYGGRFSIVKELQNYHRKLVNVKPAVKTTAPR